MQNRTYRLSDEVNSDSRSGVYEIKEIRPINRDPYSELFFGEIAWERVPSVAELSPLQYHDSRGTIIIRDRNFGLNALHLFGEGEFCEVFVYDGPFNPDFVRLEDLDAMQKCYGPAVLSIFV